MGDHHHGPAKGLSRWLYTTNHKDIGTMYLWFSFAMFLLGGAFAMIIRAELFQPGMQLVEPGFFNQMTTLHGLVMVFGAIMPSFVGLANWLIPMMIGAPDMALPRCLSVFHDFVITLTFNLVVTFAVVNYSVFFVVTRHHGSFQGRHQVNILPLGLPELSKSSRDLNNHKTSKMFRTDLFENPPGVYRLFPFECMSFL